jgi:hypothetical protein
MRAGKRLQKRSQFASFLLGVFLYSIQLEVEDMQKHRRFIIHKPWGYLSPRCTRYIKVIMLSANRRLKQRIQYVKYSNPSLVCAGHTSQNCKFRLVLCPRSCCQEFRGRFGSGRGPRREHSRSYETDAERRTEPKGAEIIRKNFWDKALV